MWGGVFRVLRIFIIGDSERFTGGTEKLLTDGISTAWHPQSIRLRD